MKNYLLLVVMNNNTFSASLHLKAQTAQSAQLTYDVATASATRLELSQVEFSSNTLYYYDSDELSRDFEMFMRRLGFRKCDTCGSWIAPQDISTSRYMGDDTRICAKCLELRKTLKVYHYHKTSGNLTYLQCDDESMTPSTFKGYGIEMEIDCHRRIVQNGEINCTEVFFQENKPHSRKKVWRLERDASLCNGVEFISNCMSYKFLQSYDWTTLTNQMKHLNCDDSLTTSGFHLHASKLILGDDEKTQALNALKLYYFMTLYKNDFFKVSGRKSMDDMHYCSFLDEDDVIALKNRILNREYGYFNVFPSCHSTCIITSGPTIEVRIFKSTSDAERIKHTLALMCGVIENLKNVPFEKIYCLGKMFKNISEETLKYWRNKGCFMKTIATTKTGETI